MSNKYFLSGLFYQHEIFTNSHADFIGINLPVLENISVESVVQYYSEQIEDNAIVYAWSLAGLFAILIKNHYPQKIKALTLFASSPYFMAEKNWSGITPKLLTVFETLLEKLSPALIKRFAWLCAYPNLSRLSDIKQYIMPDKQHLPYLKLLETTDLREEYKQLDHQTTLILGADDIVMRTTKANLEHLNKQVNLIEYKGLGHADILNKADD